MVLNEGKVVVMSMYNKCNSLVFNGVFWCLSFLNIIILNSYFR